MNKHKEEELIFQNDRFEIINEKLDLNKEIRTTMESSSKTIQESQSQHLKVVKTQLEMNKADLLKDNANKSVMIKKEIKTSETRIIQELGKLFGKATDMNNLITKSIRENYGNQIIVESIQKLSEQISRAMINYDAEFKF
jgi:hypothetical protein